MKYIRYSIYGILFSIILIKSEAISWFRIQEMFHFQSFHMYGVLLSGIGVALIGIQWVKYRNSKLDDERRIPVSKKELRWKANLAGGLLFGLGWAITGACPGPVYALIGLGVWPAWIVLLGALSGTWLYIQVKNKLP